MEEIISTIIFAKAYGIYFTIVGLGLLTCPNRFRSWYNDILVEERRVIFGGTIALLIGSFIIATHNIWTSDWRIIITLIGYWGVFAGAGSLISSKFISLYKVMINSGDIIYRLSGIAWSALGIFLFIQGFGL
ncbi:hypothetical protein DID78_05485 [Candidatus Marinamargulisbacteria bacterium SCGC AG-343-D04]|nr:hypothetical protein DID78_05485 [Candidatus Marinamargulisbacteria bacterium SCGC AG-343-D04]